MDSLCILHIPADQLKVLRTFAHGIETFFRWKHQFVLAIFRNYFEIYFPNFDFFRVTTYVY